MMPSPLPPCPSSLIRTMLTPSHARTEVKQFGGQCHDAREALTGIIGIPSCGLYAC